jgi:NTP pyrophosphatase (non-canonical NTP hydrolase)
MVNFGSLKMTIFELLEESNTTAHAKGWWDNPERNFGEQLMLMVTELAEAMEDYRLNGLTPEKLLRIENGKPEGIAAEFADVFIRVADTCRQYNIPLEKALELKSDYNRTRPYRHGNKLA